MFSVRKPKLYLELLKEQLARTEARQDSYSPVVKQLRNKTEAAILELIQIAVAEEGGNAQSTFHELDEDE